MFLLAKLGWEHYFFAISLSLLSIFMVLVILVQRGRGGGLTGALGGMGGQSAFGTKAGDLFTRITIVVAALWVLLAMAALKVLNPHGVPNYDESLRGQATPPASKTTSGGLFQGTTKSAEAPATKSSEEAAKTSTSEAPVATPPAKTESASPEGKAGENAKP